MIKIISFDLDGTLVKSDYPDKVWLEGLPSIYSKENNISLTQAKSFIFSEYDRIGEYQKEWYDIEWWFNRFQINYNWEKLLDDYRKDIKAFPEVEDTLNNLSKKYKLIVISNAKKEFIEIQLEETKLRPYFTYVFSSLSDFNTVKKLPDIYVKICQLLKIEPSEMIHVGDHKEFDYESPKKIGIKSYYLNRKNKETDTCYIHSLMELESILSILK